MRVHFHRLILISLLISFWACKNDENKLDGPGVLTLDAKNVTETKATLCGMLNAPDPVALDFEFGFELSTEPNFTEESTTKLRPKFYDEKHEFTYQLENLVPGTMYYYRAYMINQMLLYQGKAKTILTNSINNVSGEVSELTCYSAKITSHINTEDSISSFGICFGKTDQLNYYSSDHVAGGNRDDDGTFSCLLRALSGATKYYYCTYVCIDNCYYCGPVSSFTTKEDDVVETGDIDLNTLQVESILNIDDSGAGNSYFILRFGICYSYTNVAPTINDFHDGMYRLYTETDTVNTFTNTLILKLIPYETRVYYRAYVLIDNVAHYGQIKSFERGLPVFNANGHTYVNLGLSVLWATCNVGAERPEDYGEYYAWGETSNKLNVPYSWSSYRWCDGSEYTLTKYNGDNNYGAVDNKTVLELEDDAAHTQWRGDWRIPTKKEFDELLQNCTWTWITQNGVNGYLVTSNKIGFTDRSIFLPAAGGRDGSELRGVDNYGCYWSNSLYSDLPTFADLLYFRSDSRHRHSYSRHYGFSIRAVCP